MAVTAKRAWWFMFQMPNANFDGAACATSDIDPDWWTETAEDVDRYTLRQHQRAAITVCAECPILKKCANYSLRHPELRGVWGGMTERQRHAYRATHQTQVFNRAY